MSDPKETHASVPDERLIYASSNGDTWYLCENPATGLPAVKHAANRQSGGHVTYLDVESFLSKGRDPEHEALRDLIRREQFAVFLISYDIHPGQGAVEAELIEAIRSLGAWWHHLETVWIVRSDKTPIEIRDKLSAHIGADDQLLVVEITAAAAEWAGINEAGNKWLRANLNRDALEV